jgi:hypothetical protein
MSRPPATQSGAIRLSQNRSLRSGRSQRTRSAGAEPLTPALTGTDHLPGVGTRCGRRGDLLDLERSDRRARLSDGRPQRPIARRCPIGSVPWSPRWTAGFWRCRATCLRKVHSWPSSSRSFPQRRHRATDASGGHPRRRCGDGCPCRAARRDRDHRGAHRRLLGVVRPAARSRGRVGPRAVLGTGVQARSHARALVHVRPHPRDQDRRSQTCAERRPWPPTCSRSSRWRCARWARTGRPPRGRTSSARRPTPVTPWSGGSG